MSNYDLKMTTLVRCLQNNTVAPALAAAEMQDFLKSPFNDAYDYFTIKGMIRSRDEYAELNILLLKISRTLPNWQILPISKITKHIMEVSGNKLNPARIYDMLEKAGWPTNPTPKKVTIYCDMDGVCANLIKALSLVNKRSEEEVVNAWKIRKEVMWENTLGLTGEEHEYCMRTFHSPEFWANLPHIEDFHYFHAELSKLGEITFLSAADDPDHIKGKKMWLDKHFPHNARIFYKLKWHYAEPNAILIDDSHEQVDPFRQKGGHAVIVPQKWNGGEFSGRATWDSILAEVKERIKVITT